MTTRGQRTRATYEDYLNTPEGERYELLDGELVMAPSPSMRHQELAARLFVAVFMFVQERALGKCYDAPTDVEFWSGNEKEVVQPDILFVSAARAGIITEANVQGAPDLVVEVLSPSTESRDRGYKRDLYARHGVKEFWLVDPDARTVEVLLLCGSGFEVAATYSVGQTLISPVLPGLNLRLSEVFR